jgi:formamidopyrimidine-DNA glycosylase
MPELPFLTLLVENLWPMIEGLAIAAVNVRSASVLKTFDPPIESLRGHRITGIQRRGKYLIFEAGPSLAMVMHLRRHGRLLIAAAGPSSAGRESLRGQATRAGRMRDLALEIVFENGSRLSMIEMGSKKSASVWLFRGLDGAAAGPLAGLGLEPLSVAWTPDALASMLRDARMRLKSFLVTQRYVVGIGNTYADEILWEAELSPQAMTTSLDEEEIKRLHGAIAATLRRGIDIHRKALRGTLPMREPQEALAVHRHGGEPCPRCGAPIAVIHYEDHETYYCPVCQAGGRVYADRRRSRLFR